MIDSLHVSVATLLLDILPEVSLVSDHGTVDETEGVRDSRLPASICTKDVRGAGRAKGLSR